MSESRDEVNWKHSRHGNNQNVHWKMNGQRRWCICDMCGVILSHKNNKILPFVATWIDLKDYHAEWSKSKTISYSITYNWNLKMIQTKKKVKVKSLSHVRLSATLWTLAYQAPLSMGFSRQGYWSGLPFPSPGDLPNSGIEPRSPTLQAEALPSEPPRKLIQTKVYTKQK